MHTPWVIAAVLAFAIGLAHSYLGERYLLTRLLRRPDALPPLFGRVESTARTLRFAWHLTTIAWFGLGAVLLVIASPPFDAALVAMVGTNWGAGQQQRARAIAWIGSGAVAATCGLVGLFFALVPGLWMGLFTDEQEMIRAGTLYLQTVGPIYALLGLGMAIYFALQGIGNVVAAVVANALRLLVSAGGALAAVLWLDAGPQGVFIAIACGFIVYGILNACQLARRRAIDVRA